MVNFSENNPLVYTVRNLCKVCYTCVRECPVKAIKIINGQAEVIPERCIACGNCVKVCSQGAKVYYRSENDVNAILRSNEKTIACLAPSFPAEFTELEDYRILVGMLRDLGFDFVTEVSFGADLVALKYLKLFKNNEEAPVITSDCPAIVNYIQNYHPDLTDSLAPIDSPAMAMASVVKERYGADTKTVLIGPCISKKSESDSFFAVLTFTELREMFAKSGIVAENSIPSEFDPPFSGRGAMFPINHGLIRSINMSEGLEKGEVITAEGKSKFMEAIRNHDDGILKDQHLELLCCDGCIQGPGMSKRGDQFLKRKKMNDYVSGKLEKLDQATWQKEINLCSGIDLSRIFTKSGIGRSSTDPEKVNEVLIAMGRTDRDHMLNCGACGYETCSDHAVAVVNGLAEKEMCLPYAIEQLHESVENLNESNRKLADTKQALKQSEKLASMGQVSAGIAHELNNPLGIITLYSSILKDEMEKGSPLLKDISMIDEQAQRCKKIVGGLLNFARKNQVHLAECNLVEFVNQGLKSIIIPKSVTLHFEHDLSDPVAKIDPDQMIQVLTNLFRNAVEAMEEGGKLMVKLQDKDNDILIKISDTGPGIPEENMEKIFTPFFTTKELGMGTGLGLPLAYGIIKMHKGKINVISNCESGERPTGTQFIISFPRSV